MESLNHLPGDLVPSITQVLFLVEVFQQGTQIAAHTVEAPDALAAIDQVEGYYSAPLEPVDVMVDQEDTKGHHVILVNNWRGFMFQARALCPANRNGRKLQPEDQTAPVTSAG
jgi:hypothetical protein